MSKSNKGFCMFYDWVEDLDQLGDSDGAWQIVKALSEYFKNGKNPVEAVTGPLRGMVAVMFHQIRRSEDVSQKRSEAGRKGVEAKINKKPIDNQVNFASAKLQQRSATETETKTIEETILSSGTIDKKYNISIPESENAPARENENVETNLQTFGKFANVKLTPGQYEELCAEYGATTAQELIENFSAKLKAKTYHYDDHFAALQLWALQDGIRPAQRTATSFDVDEFFTAALSRTAAELTETR